MAEPIVEEPKLELDSFDPGVAELTTLKDEAAAITLTDPFDAEQVKAVRSMRIKLKNARVGISTIGKKLREGAVKFQRDVIGKERELVAIISPEEDRLAGLEEEAKKAEAIKQREADLPERRNILGDLGTEVTDQQILEMDDQEFFEFRNKLVAADLEQKRKANEAAEAERLEAARIEQERLDAQRVEQDARQAELDREEREKAEEKERIAEEERKAADLLARRAERRVSSLSELGFIQQGEEAPWTFQEFSVDRETIEKSDDDTFGQFLGTVKAEITRLAQIESDRIAEEARLEKERKEKARLEAEKEYTKFRKENGWTEATKTEYEERKVGQTIELWKKVAVFEIPQE